MALPTSPGFQTSKDARGSLAFFFKVEIIVEIQAPSVPGQNSRLHTAGVYSVRDLQVLVNITQHHQNEFFGIGKVHKMASLQRSEGMRFHVEDTPVQG
ncbi:MAG: hypothetical protein WB676_22320 [Bryobacteraceae bacterium]